MAIRPVKLKLVTRYPANIVGGDGIIVTQSGGTVTVSIDPDDMPGVLGLQDADPDLQAIADNDDNGFLVRVTEGTIATRTITGTSNEVSVTNGDGLSANPVIALPSALTFTGKTITGGTFSSPTIGTLTVTGSGTIAGTLAVTGAIDTDDPTTTIANLGLRAQVSVAETYYVGTTPVTVTISQASPGVVTWTTHGRSANDPVAFSTSGSLPTGLTAGIVYYVKTVLTADTFTVSATAGGAAINTSSAGSGTHKAWTGNDTTGTGTTGNPFMTPQAAVTYAYHNLDMRGEFLTISVRAGHVKGDGTGSGSCLSLIGSMVGQRGFSYLLLDGDTANPDDHILEGVFNALDVSSNARMSIQGFKIISASDGIKCYYDGFVDYRNINFGAVGAGSAHVEAIKGGRTFAGGIFSITGGGGYHIYASDGGECFESTAACTITGSISFSAFARASGGGIIVQHASQSYSGGTVTGKRFEAVDLSTISAQTATTFPGDSAGTTDYTSTFNTVCLAHQNVSVTPNWKGDSADPAIGNGTISAVVTQEEGKRRVEIVVVMGSTTTFGTGDWYFTLPSPYDGNANGSAVGSAYILDSGTAAFVGVSMILVGANKIYVYTNNAATGIRSNSPMTWAQNDILRLSIEFPIA